MKSIKEIEHIVQKKLTVKAGPHLYERLLVPIRQADGQSRKTTTAPWEPIIRNLIMKKSIIKLSTVTVVVIAVLIGFHHLDVAPESVAWGEVLEKVEASQGIRFRSRTNTLEKPDKRMRNCRTLMHRRTDWLDEEGVPTRIVYFNLEEKTSLWLAHDEKVWSKMDLDDKKLESIRNDWRNPKAFAKQMIAAAHEKLGQKMIDGTSCEGLLVTDQVAMMAKGPVRAELWVSVETGYPVFMKIEILSEENGSPIETILVDEIEWDIDGSAFEIERPSDYRILE
jgi:hypothetical protein